MNKIVRRHYPVERLPDDLKQELPGALEVTVTIEVPGSDPVGEPMTSEEIFASRKPLVATGSENGLTRFAGRFPDDVTPHEAVARIRALRDEWDD
jgi:fructose-specific phosphotransferase system component IIB